MSLESIMIGALLLDCLIFQNKHLLLIFPILKTKTKKTMKDVFFLQNMNAMHGLNCDIIIGIDYNICNRKPHWTIKLFYNVY